MGSDSEWTQTPFFNKNSNSIMKKNIEIIYRSDTMVVVKNTYGKVIGYLLQDIVYFDDDPTQALNSTLNILVPLLPYGVDYGFYKQLSERQANELIDLLNKRVDLRKNLHLCMIYRETVNMLCLIGNSRTAFTKFLERNKKESS